LTTTRNKNEQQQDAKNNVEFLTRRTKKFLKIFEESFKRGQNSSIVVQLVKFDDDDDDDVCFLFQCEREAVLLLQEQEKTVKHSFY
jgi:hypothetical protein